MLRADVKVKLILPALTEATSPFWRPIKYSLFPPLGLATLAGYLADDDDIEICDEHVEALNEDDAPDLVVIQVYITSAYRAYRLADRYRSRGAHVALGGLHVTSLPDEAAEHADTIFLGPGEDTWPRFLADFRRGCAGRVYRSEVRTLADLPPIRRDLIKRQLYLVPNSIVVSRGCPHVCDFCYKEAFFEGGHSFYTQTVDAALAEIDRLPGRHLYFLDDHLFGAPRFAAALFDGMRGMGRLWQAAATVNAVLAPGLLERAADAGLRSLFVGFETLNSANLLEQRKYQNLRRDYGVAIRRLHDAGVMINGSFVFGMDGDDVSVFDRTVEWAIEQGIETATFHILTPYPGTALHRRLGGAGADHVRELGPVRHAAHGLSTSQDVGKRARARLPPGLPGVLPMDLDRPRRVRARGPDGRPAPSRVRGGVEEVRAVLGCGDSRETRRTDASGARKHSRRVRQTCTAVGAIRPRCGEGGVGRPLAGPVSTVLMAPDNCQCSINQLPHGGAP